MSERKIKSNSLSKLFDDAQETEISIGMLKPYDNHCFDKYDEGKLWNLADSIADNGLISPIIVRQTNVDEYEILSGHNRFEAVKLLGREMIECKIIDVDDINAAVIVIESNLEQRAFSELRISNQIRVITEYYNAIKRQGIRTDLVHELEEMTSGHSDLKLNTRKAVAKKFNLSERKMARLIKMNTLIDEFKVMLDDRDLKFMVAYEFSFLSTSEQKLVYKCMEESKQSVKKYQAEKIRRVSKEGNINKKVVLDILNQTQVNLKERRAIDFISDFFEVELTEKQFEEIERMIRNYIKNVSP